MSRRRSLPDGADPIVERIFEALQVKSPRSPGELTKFAKADRVVVRHRIKQLVKAGQLTVTGATANRLVYLGKSKAPAAATVQRTNGSGQHVPPASPASTLDHVEMLDVTLLANLKAAGRTGRSMRELKISHPDESEEQLQRSLTRLKVKQKAHVDEGGRWTAAS